MIFCTRNRPPAEAVLVRDVVDAPMSVPQWVWDFLARRSMPPEVWVLRFDGPHWMVREDDDDRTIRTVSESHFHEQYTLYLPTPTPELDAAGIAPINPFKEVLDSLNRGMGFLSTVDRAVRDRDGTTATLIQVPDNPDDGITIERVLRAWGPPAPDKESR